MILKDIDAYRGAARRAAWKSSPDDHDSFNPFIQRGVQRRRPEEESAQVRTDRHDSDKVDETQTTTHLGTRPSEERTHDAKLVSSSSEDATFDVTEIGLKHVQSTITLTSQARLLLFNSWLHLLFLFIPAGFAVNYCRVNPIVVFCINFVAIIPSAMDIALAVDEISLRVGEILEGIISITFRWDFPFPERRAAAKTSQQCCPAHHFNIFVEGATSCRFENVSYRHDTVQPSANEWPRFRRWRLPANHSTLQHHHCSTSLFAAFASFLEPYDPDSIFCARKDFF